MIAPEGVKIPCWIRLGKWSAKVRVEAKLIPESAIELKSGQYICVHPLNPLDLSSSTRLLLYNRIVMPPVSLVSQAQLMGDYWELKSSEFSELPDKTSLPSGVAYGASSVVTAS